MSSLKGSISSTQNFSGGSSINIIVTPNVTIGTITTLEPNASVTVELDESSTKMNPVFNFGIPMSPAKSDIYKVASIEERDTIQAEENDMCVVYEPSTVSYNGETTIDTTIAFPEQIVVDEAITSSYTGRFRVSSGGLKYLFLTLNSSSYTVSYGASTSSAEVYASYTSNDGKTYTRTSTETTVTLPAKPRVYGTINTVLYPFILFPSFNLVGLFKYLNSSWQYAEIGVPTTADKILNKEVVYTNAGRIEGTLLSDTTESLNSSINYIENYVESLPNITTLTNCKELYKGNTQTSLITVSKLNTTNVTAMTSMFHDCANLTEIDVSNFDTSNVTDMVYMFKGCASIKKLDLSHFNTSKVTNIFGMFGDCTLLEEIDFSNAVTSAITNKTIMGMFQNCINLKKIDVRKFDFTVFNTGTSYTNGAFKDVPKDCLIIVKNTTNRNWIKNYCRSDLTNIKTVAEII